MRQLGDGSPSARDPAIQLWHGLVGLAIALEGLRGMLSGMPSSGLAIVLAPVEPDKSNGWLRAYA